MKILYIILFFIDFIGMIVLSFIFVRLLDTSHRALPLLADATGILISIMILFFMVSRFLKFPLHHDQ